MSISSKDLSTIKYTFIPILCSLIVSAIVNLQLFQDGSSYLLELLISQSAIRHERLSVFLIQLPTVLTNRLLMRLGVSRDISLQIIRLVFSLSYAVIPLLTLILSWLIIRRRNESLFIWA